MIRRATEEDIPLMLNIIKLMGSGMGASLRINSEKLATKLEQEIWFVLVVKNYIVGMSGLCFVPDGVWAYHKKESKLTLEKAFRNSVQMSSQFLLPQFRRTGIARRLTSGPLQYIKENPDMFPDLFFGEMRGCYDDNGRCPFWSAFSWPFGSYNEYTRAIYEGKEEEIISKLPKEINLDTIPKEARNVVGKVHPETEGNMKLAPLFGFRVAPYISYSCGAPFLFREGKPL